MTPDIAIVDPELTLSCPQGLTAASGLDAFIQAVEGFTNPKANTITMALSAKACSKIFANIELAYKKPSDLGARTEMAEGSLLSALAFSQTGLGAIHGIAHPVGSLLGVPHGIACAIVMGQVLEWNMPACKDDYTILANACGFKTAEDFVVQASELAKRLNVPKNLRGYGLSSEHFPFIIKNCRSASMSLNPRPMSDEDVSAVLERLL